MARITASCCSRSSSCPAGASPLLGKWTVFYVGDGACDEDCHQALWVARQTRVSLNKDMPRIKRALFATANCCDRAFLDKEHQDLQVFDGGSSAAVGELLVPAATLATTAMTSSSPTPLGNIVMRFDARTRSARAARRSQEAAAALAYRISHVPHHHAASDLPLPPCCWPSAWWCSAPTCDCPMRGWAALTGPGVMATSHPLRLRWPMQVRRRAPFEVGKAWREMIHRYGAGTLVLLILVIAGLALKWRRQPGVPWLLPSLLVLLVVFQALLGMWTVTLLVKPLIVTLHLIFGLTTLSLLWWLWLTLRRRTSNPWSGTRSARGGGQHGRTCASRASGTATPGTDRTDRAGGCRSCSAAGPAPTTPRLPARISRSARLRGGPRRNFRDAFVLWRGLGVNYEGGVLASLARVAIHFTHRLGAIVATVLLVFVALRTLWSRQEGQSRIAAIAVARCVGIAAHDRRLDGIARLSAVVGHRAQRWRGVAAAVDAGVESRGTAGLIRPRRYR